MFSPLQHPACLYNITTKDLVTNEIQVSLFNAKELDRQQMKEFGEQTQHEILNLRIRNDSVSIA